MPTKSHSEGDLVICERGTGTWNYHLRRVGAEGLHMGGARLTPLCGSQISGWDTQLPVETWGHRDHIPSTWCRACAQAAGLEKPC